MWHIEVDRDRCMATGGCVHALPRLFQIGDDEAAHVTGPVDGDDQLVRNVVAECPTGALRLVRTDDPSDSMAAPAAGPERKQTFR